ncbi:hypothetical protein [Actinomycetospora atypica]|uniref:DUF559 domain-containing protein n=1 Tax=Actinomycetospora atypica TaxID=1290095 RepID=A0ABV9YSF3_9PSEU
MESIRGPFRADEALARGGITRGRLAGPTVTRLLPNVHAPADQVPTTLAERARAAVLYVRGTPPVVGGFAAAELLGASCGPRDAPVDLVVGPRRVRPRSGLVIRQDVLDPDDVVDVEGVLVTSAERTAWDLARRLRFDDAVVAVDALARVGRFPPAVLLERPVGRRGCLGLADVVAGSDPRSASPPETRMRLIMARRDVPPPIPQYVVFDDGGLFVARVDFGWKEVRVAGEHHRTDRAQWRRDQRRTAELAACDWVTVPWTGDDVVAPREFVQRLLATLAHRGLGTRRT